MYASTTITLYTLFVTTNFKMMDFSKMMAWIAKFKKGYAPDAAPSPTEEPGVEHRPDDVHRSEDMNKQPYVEDDPEEDENEISGVHRPEDDSEEEDENDENSSAEVDGAAHASSSAMGSSNNGVGNFWTNVRRATAMKVTALATKAKDFVANAIERVKALGVIGIVKAVGNLATKAKDFAANAIERVKALGMIGTVKAFGNWMALHPWETAAIISITSIALTAIILSAAIRKWWQGQREHALVLHGTASPRSFPDILDKAVDGTIFWTVVASAYVVYRIKNWWQGYGDDRSRTINSQGRQKSCSECVKAKRKCGLEQPHCSRCTRQHLSCIYPPQPRSQSTLPPIETPEVESDIGTTDSSGEMNIFEHTNLPFDFDMAAPTTIASDMLDFDFSAGASSLDVLTEMLDLPTNHHNQMAVYKTSSQARKPFSAAHISTLAQEKVAYSMKHFKSVPKMMVEKNCTPWAHPMLYDEYMPRSIQDAYAACALYITKNDTNAEFVGRFIMSRAEELVTASTLSTTPIEILAQTQALMLYQIMLMFGGDVRFYAQAEALLPYLYDMATLLLPIAAEETDPVGVIPLYPSTAARSAWRSYIMRESARRTVLSAFHMNVLFTVMNGQLTPCSADLVLNNRVTLSAHLWKAANAFDFAIAWNEKTHFVIKELDFTDVLKHGQPDDLDVFGNMMLVGIKGMDDMRGWYHTRGGTL
ncbi:c6 zinc finger domain-containing [Pyrenophora seminiperda CCB06]|uniref:C6 zinc finger domain-containing n=1 Tax=Pyrenophora seminiperda CCB06 TaxID=1302712 RepID=A0A3M7MAE8_9PLEO|nr:c6 zinc finger domain-containing [Pyrenophora seminiperda CCB06]